ncbi:hypothetical protein H0X06_03270, partial [Candidatus Dependentiae bacterium]|nr:hypothetical protein [Candidatus Dependentiae bacterium]
MITVTLTTQSLLETKADAYVFFADHGFDPAHFSKTAGALYPQFEEAIKMRGFSGTAESSLILTGVHNGRAVFLVFLGLGDLRSGYGNIETYRRSLGYLVRTAESHKFTSFSLTLPDPIVLGLSTRRLGQETSTILHKAEYHFNEYITSEDRKYSWNIDAFIVVDEASREKAQKGIDQGIIIAGAINTARYWGDMPPSTLTPPIFAQQAVEMAEQYGLKSTVFGRDEIVKMGMGGIEGVARGSMHEPRLVILEYKSAKPNAPTIALVGKGITFDSGGLCIK